MQWSARKLATRDTLAPHRQSLKKTIKGKYNQISKMKYKKFIPVVLMTITTGLFANDPFLQRMEEIAKIRNGEKKEAKAPEKSSEEIMLEMKEAKAKVQAKVKAKLKLLRCFWGH